MRHGQFWWRWLLPMCAVCVALAAVGPRPVAAATLAAQVTATNSGAAIVVTGSGFGTNETIKLVGATNNGRQALYPDAKSDNNGAFTATLFYDASVMSIQATGDPSRTQTTAQVTATVTNPGNPYPGNPYPGNAFPGGQYPGNPYPGYPYTGGQFPGGQFPGNPFPGGVYPGQPYIPGQPVLPGPGLPGGNTAVGVGQTVNVAASGFAANEKVSVWITAPDASVQAQPGTDANAQGNVSVTVTFSGPGMWQVTTFGLSSGNQVISRYVTNGAVTGVPGGYPYPGGGYPGQPIPGGAYPGGGFPGYPGGGYPGGPQPQPQPKFM